MSKVKVDAIIEEVLHFPDLEDIDPEMKEPEIEDWQALSFAYFKELFFAKGELSKEDMDDFLYEFTRDLIEEQGFLKSQAEQIIHPLESYIRAFARHNPKLTKIKKRDYLLKKHGIKPKEKEETKAAETTEEAAMEREGETSVVAESSAATDGQSLLAQVRSKAYTFRTTDTAATAEDFYAGCMEELRSQSRRYMTMMDQLIIEYMLTNGYDEEQIITALNKHSPLKDEQKKYGENIFRGVARAKNQVRKSTEKLTQAAEIIRTPPPVTAGRYSLHRPREERVRSLQGDDA